MNKNTITLTGDDSDVRLAKIVAQLVREGVTFTVNSDFDGYVIKLTGGF